MISIVDLKFTKGVDLKCSHTQKGRKEGRQGGTEEGERKERKEIITM